MSAPWSEYSPERLLPSEVLPRRSAPWKECFPEEVLPRETVPQRECAPKGLLPTGSATLAEVLPRSRLRVSRRWTLLKELQAESPLIAPIMG